MTFDITSFFEFTKKKKIFSFFYHKLKCSADVADLLAEICTYKGTLVTGSPVSPILSFWANYDMFEVINKRALDYSLNFTLYIDDITLSGDSIPIRMKYIISDIVKAYGYQINVKKTKTFIKSDSKHITGLVISENKLRVPHSRFRKLRLLRDFYLKESIQYKKIKILERICGLVGEASYIDNRYSIAAERSYRDLRNARTAANTK